MVGLIQQRGFTLLEVIVTITILAAASAIILEQVGLLLQYSSRAGQQAERINNLMNEAEIAGTLNLNPWQNNLEKETLLLENATGELRGIAPDQVVMENFSITLDDISITLAYTPFQIMSVRHPETRFESTVIRKGLIVED